MKIKVKTKESSKTFKSDYYSNASTLNIEGLAITGFLLLFFILVAGPTIAKNGASGLGLLIIFIPLLFFIIYLAALLNNNNNNQSKIEINIDEMVLNIENRKIRITSNKWKARKANFYAGRSITINSFDYFVLDIPTSVSYSDIKITTEDFISLRDYIQEHSQVKITID